MRTVLCAGCGIQFHTKQTHVRYHSVQCAMHTKNRRGPSPKQKAHARKLADRTWPGGGGRPAVTTTPTESWWLVPREQFAQTAKAQTARFQAKGE